MSQIGQKKDELKEKKHFESIVNEENTIASHDHAEEEEKLIVSEIEQTKLPIAKQENTDELSDNCCCNIFTQISNAFIWFYSLFLPSYENYSEILLLLILVITYLHSTFVLFIIERLSNLTSLSPSFLGMTILSWGGNVGDTLNASIAAKINAGDLLVTSILGSQIMNLQLCLGVPWLISIIKNYIEGKSVADIDFGSRKPMKYIFPLFLVVLASIFIMTLFDVNLNKRSGICLIIVYLIYFVYELQTNIK